MNIRERIREIGTVRAVGMQQRMVIQTLVTEVCLLWFFSVLLGIFLAYGPDIRVGKEVKTLKIVDLAPTILHLMGVPIPNDVDGRVLREIFRERSKASERTMQYQDAFEEKKRELRVSEEEEREIKDRLRSLGYLG